MKITEDLKEGDIFLNPLAYDLWILRQDIYEDEEDESWVLSLVHADCIEKYEYVEGFIKIGNIYELCHIKDDLLGLQQWLESKNTRYLPDCLAPKITIDEVLEYIKKIDLQVK